MTPTLQQMADHLEFLGYIIEVIEPTTPQEKKLVLAKNTQKNNVVFFELTPSLVLFRVNLTTEKTYVPKMDTLMNDANKRFSLSRIYHENQDSKVILRVEAVYTNDYTKTSFAHFIETFTAEQSTLINIEDFSSVFIE